MPTDPVPQPVAPAPGADADATARAVRRLQAWEARHPDAAALAMLASLAVRIDSALLRRLRLQLLPRAEPGIEADVWFSGLHASRGRDAVVLDPAVQQLLRNRLAQQAAGADGRRPLDAAAQITATLHADAPAALQLEEALTWAALRGGTDLPARIETLLAPALAAMAQGGDARALEVARWAQRAVPQLPDAARSHPAALALWLAALLRLGLPATRLPDTGAAGLPPALQWLLPAGQVQALQRVAVVPFDEQLVLRPLAGDAPAEASEITLPATRPLLVALDVVGGDAGPAARPRQMVALAAAETRVPLPPGWQAMELHSLTGARWRLQRQAGELPTDVSPLPWRRMRALVLSDHGRPEGMATFLSSTELVTSANALPIWLGQQLSAGDTAEVSLAPVRVRACNTQNVEVDLLATAVVLDLRSALVLLVLQQPFTDAVAPKREAYRPIAGLPGTTVPGLDSVQHDTDLVDGRFTGASVPSQLLAGRPPVDPLSRHVGLQLATDVSRLLGMAGAPVFHDNDLLGIVDLGSAQPDGTVLWAVPSAAIDRFLDWARTDTSDWPQLLLHHPVDDPYGKGAEIDERAAQRLEAAARRARVRLLQRDATQPARSVIDDADDPAFLPGLAGVVRLVTPVTREGSAPAARLRLLALAARRWAQPRFGVLTLGFRRDVVNEAVPAPLASAPRLLLDKLDDEMLARALLDLADPPPPLPPLLEASTTTEDALLVSRTRLALLQQVPELARPFAPSTAQNAKLKELVERLNTRDGPTLMDVADFISPRWTRSSRLDALPLVEVLAQLALPLNSARLIYPLRNAPRGAWALNAMPAQFGRLLIARAQGGDRAPPCIVVRDQAWGGATSIVAIETLVVATIAAALHCTVDEARAVMQRVELPLWVLVTTRPLPDRKTLLDLELRLPAARWLFLAGDQPDLAEAARTIGAALLPAIEPGADLRWLQGYKRLMEWARPRKRSAAAPDRKPTKAAPRQPLRK